MRGVRQLTIDPDSRLPNGSHGYDGYCNWDAEEDGSDKAPHDLSSAARHACRVGDGHGVAAPESAPERCGDDPGVCDCEQDVERHQDSGGVDSPCVWVLVSPGCVAVRGCFEPEDGEIERFREGLLLGETDSGGHDDLQGSATHVSESKEKPQPRQNGANGIGFGVTDAD